MNFLFSTQKNPYGQGPIGGAESSIKLLAGELAKKGHTVVYLTKNVTKQSRYNASNYSVELVSYREISRGRRFYLIRRFNDFLKAIPVLWVCLRWKIDIIYFFYEINLALPILNVCKLLKRPRLVLRMAGLSWYEKCLSDKNSVKLYKKLFNGVDSINFIHGALLNNAYDKAKKAGFSLNPKEFFTLDIGTNIKINKANSKKGSRSGAFEIVMATRFTNYQKRQDVLLRAVSLIPAEENLRVTFIGDGENLQYIKHLAAELGAEERVTFHPFMDQKALWETLSNSDLLCHSVEYEGLGKIIIESMAMGLPVLASRVVSIKDYIEDDINGFLEDNDPCLWARRIIFLMRNPELLDKVSKNSIRFIENNYDKDVNVTRYEDEFKRTLST